MLRAISRSMAAKKKVRLKSPVSESTVDRRMAASRVRRCARAMTIATYDSRIRAVRLTPTVATVAGPRVPAAEPTSTARM